MMQNRVIEFKEHARTPEENAFLKLQARKEILEDQLRSLTNRRDELAGNLEGRSGADKEGIEARVRSLDAQIQATEAELNTATKEAATAAVPSYAESVQRIYEGFDEGDMFGAGFGGAAIMFALF